ncbi:MAG: hypothetical protein LAO09_20360 [Acidobacteriia bacterium]|nr:hypothetical protein [Terriglobia bacterium]
MRFEPQRGIYAAGEVTLQNFQVHHMVCSQDRVEISGWGNIFKKYTIDIAGPEKPKVVDFAEDPTRRFDPAKDGPDPPQFDYAQAGPVALESLDPDHQYTLWLSASEKNVEGGVEHYRKAELTQADAQGTVSQRLVLYENRFLETID